VVRGFSPLITIVHSLKKLGHSIQYGSLEGTTKIKEDEASMTILGAIVRFIVSALVLMVVGLLVPGFDRLSFTSALLAAAVIAVMGWIIEALFGRNMSPYGRGIVGFLVGVAVIYAAQWFVPGMRVTILGAILASLVIGLIDLFVPGDLKGSMMGNRRSERRND
jgi:putative membrane protein